MLKYLQHITDQIGAGLSHTASQVGVVLSHLWIVVVKQQVIQGTLGVSVGVLLVISSIISLRFLRYIVKQQKMDTWDKGALIILLSVLTAWLAVRGIATSITWLPHMLNPEYYAIQDSIQILHQVKQ